MDKNNIPIPARQNRLKSVTVLGIVLIVTGILVLLDRWLKTGWLALAVLPLMGVLLLVGGIGSRELRMIIPGAIITGLGLGIFIYLGIIYQATWTHRLGLSLLVFGLGWLLLPLLTYQYAIKTAWWALVPGASIASLGAFFIYSPMRPVDLALFLGTALGMAFIIWGVIRKLFGLIIPGALLAAIGPTLYLAWGLENKVNILTRTGITLVGFALGWILITILSRAMTHRIVWWPLIPGGVLAMVGWGLYIGGNPGNAAVFISNTGSIGLILFGIYLLLLRKGIQG